MATQNAGGAPPMAVEAGVSPERDRKTMAALMAAQEVSRAPQTAVEVGGPLDEMRR
jgi:hypothetical protein